jgi:hypothetical protein
MRAKEIWILGAITGAVVIWLWRSEVRGFVRGKPRQVRAGVAEGIRAAEAQAGRVLDKGGEVLRRAEGFVQDTKKHVSEALRAGEAAVRPESVTGEA